MDTIQRSLDRVLNKAVGLLRGAELDDEDGGLVARFEALISQVYEPCMVAVVGQVKVGKSSFINALLRVDLAKVDKTETTATINQFRYGKITSGRPVRVVWRQKENEPAKEPTYETLDFVNSLQGHDEQAVSRAEDIDHLEYYLLNDYLEQVTLVDTPGMSSTVAEHQHQSAEFMRLDSLLRRLQDENTRRFGDTANAIIYLLKTVALFDDKEYLEEFQRVSQGSARSFNAIGVVSKVDEYLMQYLNQSPDNTITQGQAALDRQTQKIAAQLKDYVNTVVPVSAGVQRALHCLLENDAAGLQQMMQLLRPLPADTLDELLSSHRRFLQTEVDIPLEQRSAWLDMMEFDVLSTIAHVVASPDLKDVHAVREKLEAIVGFDRLKEVLERHIFKRKVLLRCYTLVNDARNLLNDMRTRTLVQLRKSDTENAEQLDQLLRYISRTQSEPVLAQELAACVRAQLAPRADRVEAILTELDRDFSRVFHELKHYNAEFEALHQVLDNQDKMDVFSAAEVEELKALLGLRGLETRQRLSVGEMSVAYVEGRYRLWAQASMRALDPVRRNVAQQARIRYGMLLEELRGSRAGGPA